MSAMNGLVFVEDPGAANMVVGLANEAAGRGFHLDLVAAGAARETLTNRGEAFRDASEGVLDVGSYSIVAVGTSENTRTLAFDLINRARQAGIPSVGIVDFYSNAQFRFRGETGDALAHAPDLILVPDDLTRDAYVRLGHPDDRVITVGHPQYDFVQAYGAELDAEGRESIRARILGADLRSRSIAVFLGEISGGLNPQQFVRSEEYSLAGHPDRPGRTDVVLDELFTARERVGDNHAWIFRPHPHQDQAERARQGERFDAVSEGGNPLDLVYAADAVVGMTTMLLQEAAILGKPTLSIVPRHEEAGWLPTVLAGITPCAWTRESLEREIRSLPTRRGVRFPVRPGSLRRISDALSSIAAGGSR